MKANRPHNLRRKALAVLVAACYGSAHAAPVNPVVVAGQATFNQQGKTYTITNTPNAIINWQGFSIGADEITRFVQQSSDSRVLNRITGQDPTQILGSLQSNGKVFLINPNGIVFGAGARVDVNGLVASSLNISNADFLAGKNNFDGAANAGKVSNQGTITTPSGGQIFLIAPAVENSGIISSPNGDVVLAAGHSVQLFDSNDPNVQVVVSSPSDQALNLGSIVAQGGRVGVYGALVNQRGVINANSAVRGENGKIVLKASGTTLVEAGSVTSASGSNLNTGGDILLLGQQVGVTGNAVVDASGAAGGGTLLVGGDYQGKNAAVMNAQQAYLGKDAVLRADATDSGNGGKVVVWSDQATQMFGTISARGGASGGNGGQVETSGHYLNMQGTVDTRAPKGVSGSLLLDPSDVYISVDGSNVAGMVNGGVLPLVGSVFVDTSAVKDSLLLTGVLQTALLTTDVTISTANANGTGSGVISVLSPLEWSSSRSLNLQANSDIQLKAGITGIYGGLNMTAGGAITQVTSPIDALKVSSVNAIAAGSITLDNNSNTIGGAATLVSNGGNVTLTAVNVNLGASSAAGTLTANAYNGDLLVSGNISGAGGVTLASNKAGGAVTIDQAVTSSAGNISLMADKMTLNGAISASTQHSVQLQPNQDSVNIVVGGSAADGTGVLGLSEAELQHISLAPNGLLSIGTSFNNSAATGTLTVDGSLDLHSSLSGGGLLLQTQSGALNINSGAALTVPGVISLQILTSGDHRVSNAGTVSSNSNINIFAGTMTLAGGTLSAPSVSLESTNQINLGATGNPANTLALTNADLASASTAPNLYVSVNGGNPTGDIVVSAPISTAHNLNLTAQRNIALQSSLNTGGLRLDTPGNISATGDVAVSGVFELTNGSWSQNSGTLPAFSATDFRLTGGSFLRVQGGDGSLSLPYQLADAYGLQGAATLAAYNAYVLNGDIDASGTAAWNNPTGLAAAGFKPISTDGYYTGVFDGAGHAISGLTINRPGESNVGLFGQVATGTIRDLTLNGAAVTGASNVGALAGYVSQGLGYISNVNVSGQVTGIGNAGALVGNNGGLITGSGSSGSVTGLGGYNASNIGGLVGRNTNQVADSWSSADVVSHGQGYTGGLVGSNTGSGQVLRSFASGSVDSSGEIIGGLVGDNNNYASISLSYATGSVSGGRNVGGLAGRNTDSASISNAYATGDVSGNFNDYSVNHQNIGGLIGDLYGGSVSNVYSIGVVNGYGFDGGVHGAVGAHESGTLTHGYFNLDTAGTNSDPAGATGLTSDEMTRGASYAGFDLASTWRIYDGHTTPLLKNFLTPYQVTVTGGGNVTKIYDGTPDTAFTGTTGTLPSGINGNLGFDGAVNVGTYGVGGLWSTTYDISYTGATASQLTITPRTVTATVSASKVYDGNTFLEGQASYTFSGLVGSDMLGAYGLVQFDNKNVGTNKTLTSTGTELTGNYYGNYVLSNATVTGNSGTITAAPLATWTGTGPGLWSASSNWLNGLVPEGANVLTAALGGSAGLITYDGTAGNTTLVTLTSTGAPLTLTGGKLTLTGSGDAASNFAGTLTQNGGGLDVLGRLHANTLVLTSGVLNGIGSYSQLETDGLTQTGGVINSAGAVSIGSSGNITLGNIHAHSLLLNTGLTGSITQNSGTQLVADTVNANAHGDITLTNSNQVGAFAAGASGAGNIALNNTVSSGELELGPLTAPGNIVIDNHGGIHTAGAISGGGLVSITAHSPVTINDAISGNDIQLAASTDITLNSNSQLLSSHAIGLTAGANILLGGVLSVPSGGSISAVATSGNISTSSGTQINSAGSPVSLSAPNGTVSTQGGIFGAGTVPVVNQSPAAAAAAAAAAQAAA
ncbi:two-partner secretion domain-containing protein, partial [Duganella alba]|uniref:two-partner secretion domain-containing protein n=2 Tax=Duganella alba TaxID=2666081 RepID=UPI00140C84A5